MTDAVVSPALITDEAARPSGRPRAWSERLLAVPAAVLLGAALVDPRLGQFCLVPFGLLLAAGSGSVDAGSRRSVILSKRNFGLAAAMVTAVGWFWQWRLDLAESRTLVAVAAAVIALPLALHESDTGTARQRTFAVTRRSLILSNMALVTFVYVYQDAGVWFFGLAVVCVVLPLVLATSRALAARRGRIEVGLLRHPLRPEVRAHLLQGLNIWLCCGLLAAVVTAGGTHYARIGFALSEAQFGVVVPAFAVGLALLAALAIVPRQRVDIATNAVVALLSTFLAVQIVPLTVAASDAVVLNSPLPGEWFVQNGGRSFLINGHAENERNAVDFQLMGTNGRTHTGGSNAPLADYVGFGMPVLAPVDGRVVEVTDPYADNPPGTNSDHANSLVVDITGGRYVLMAHLEQGSVTVEVGDVVRRGQQIAAVGNNGHTNAPHLHLQVQDSPTGRQDADRTYPMVFRDVHITRGGLWPWGDSRELRTGDLVRDLAR